MSVSTVEDFAGDISEASGNTDLETEGDDSCSEPSEQVNEDLKNALAENFEFSGRYYYYSTDKRAPNPGLTIEGMGLISLPLSERDANRIISHSTQGPIDEAEKMAVDIYIYITEIDPAHVSFANPEWQTFIGELVSTAIPATLGFSPESLKPRCELYKLLLYQPGSLQEEYAPKPDGTFATVLVVLPSIFEGGEIHLSHFGQKNVLNVSGHSAFDTSTLVWYTDVAQEFKPITSGYRLALSYNLIHTVPGCPRPSHPDTTEGIEAIRRVLTKWKDGKYRNPPSPGLVTCVLSELYPSKDFNLGVHCLRGPDANKAAHLLLVATELGFTIGLANLEVLVYTATKYVDSGDEWGDHEQWIIKASHQSKKLSNLVSVPDGKVLCLDSFEVDDKSLVPRGALRKNKTTRKVINSDVVEHYCDRSVLVLFPEKDEARILVKINGPVWATKVLKENMDNSTAPRTQKIAASLLNDHLVNFSHTRPSLEVRASAALALMTYAVAVKDAVLYNSALPFSHHALVPTSDFAAIKEGLAVFGLPSLKVGLEAFVKRTHEMEERCGLLQAIETRVGGEAISEWAEALQTDIIFSYTACAKAKFIPTLIWIAKRKGLEALQTKLVRDILKEQGTYAFLILLAQVLHEHRDEFPATPVSGTDPEAPSTPLEVGVSAVIRQCILAAYRQWDAVSAVPPKEYDRKTERSSSQVGRICEIVDLCYTVQDLMPCTPLLVSILIGNAQAVFTPLVPELKATLAKYNTQITDEPFNSFFKHMMSQYLVNVLGDGISAPRLNIKLVGCGCPDCSKLDAFFKDSSPSITFKCSQARRTHLEGRIQIGGVGYLLTCDTKRHGTPHSLVVSKRPEILAALTWKGRQIAAAAFVKDVGEQELQTIMGAEKWLDLLKAVEGTHSFMPLPWNGVLPFAGDVSVGAAAASGSGAPLVVGVKRKRPDSPPKNVIDTIC